MNKDKLTPWFDGNVKPARVGPYLREHAKTERLKLPCEMYSMWNGEVWKIWNGDVQKASRERMTSDYQNRPWRGLSSAPKGKT